jgi:eukaryotic-like serine/threonine-protein kinase
MPLGHFAWKAGSHFSRYEILGRLSAGGMAEVWRARVLGVESFQKDIVIKTMRPELADTPDLVRMFINEAEIAARMNHPGMVQVFDFGQYEGRYFIAMEYVPGRSLRQLGRSFRLKQRRLPRKFFLRAMLDVVRALSYGHALTENGVLVGFVHRDVSPENVMISYAGATKLIDFGAAATANTPPPSSSVVGKLRYLSPERLRGNVGDARSDLYSVGIMLYEYLAGISPFDGQDMVKKIIDGQAPDITTKVNVPPGVARVVRRAMAADLRKRYGWADRLADELGELLASDLGHDPYAADEGDVLEHLRKAGVAQHEAPAAPEGQGQRLRVLPPAVNAPADRSVAPVPAPPAAAAPPTDVQADARSPFRRTTPRPTPAVATPKPAISLDDVSVLQEQVTPPATSRTAGGSFVSTQRSASGSLVSPPGAPPPGVSQSGTPPRPPMVPAPAARSSTPVTLADPFSVVRRAGVNPVAAWVRGSPPEIALPQSPPANSLNEDEAVAAACFDRGLSLVSERRPLDAVLYWERAVALAPTVAMYQEQLRRLVTQIRDEKDGGGSRTPTPRRTSIRKAD